MAHLSLTSVISFDKLIAEPIRATIRIIGKREFNLTTPDVEPESGSVLVERLKEERAEAVGNRISPKPHAFSDPVSLGDLCQAMFIEGARVLGYAGEAFVPTEVQEQIFLAAVMIADGLESLLQSQYGTEQESTA